MELGDSPHRRWIVARTRSGREIWAMENACALGYQVYLPKIIERRSRHGQKVTVPVPLFPTYLFVLAADRWRILLSAFGVAGIVMRGSEPDTLPKKIIEQIRSRENTDGFIELPKIEEPIRPDVKVQILKGPMAGHVGVVAGMRDHQRCKVLVEFLGRKTDCLIATTDLMAAA